MSWGHEALELEEDADERAVKRAYAKRLRVTRPDDDPHAFQQLHEAYQAALQWAQHRQQWLDDQTRQDEQEDRHHHEHATATSAAPPLHDLHVSADALHATLDLDRWLAAEDVQAPAQHDPVQRVDGGGVFEPHPGHVPPPGMATPPALPPHVPLDVDAFVHTLLGEAAEREPAAFAHWLQRQPQLWSLTDKPRIGAVLLQHLLHGEHALPTESFGVLAQQFGWDEIGSPLDPYVAENCRLRLHRRWLLRPQRRAALAAFLSAQFAPVTAQQAGTRLGRLTRPLGPWQAAWQAWPQGRVPQMRDTLARLGVNDVADTTPPLRAEQVGFWLDAADIRRLNGARLRVALLRSALSGLAVVATLGLLSWLTDGDTSAVDLGFMLKVSAISGAVVFVLGTLMLPLRSLLQWQTAGEDMPRRWPLLCLWLVPLLALVSLLLIHAADQRVAGTVLAWLTLLLGIARWWQRGHYELRFNGWMLLALVPFVKLGGVALLFGEVALGGAMLAWTVDALRNVMRR